MIKKFKKIAVCLVLGGSLFLGGGITASASSCPMGNNSGNANSAVSGANWSNRFTRSVNRGTSWWAGTACNSRRTSSRGWDIDVASRTMSSRPVTRLSNLMETVTSSNTLTVPSNNGILRTSSGNPFSTGNIRLQSRPSAAQVVSSASMSIRYSAR